MKKKYRDINDEVNTLLKKGLFLAQVFSIAGQKELAKQILATTSQCAYLRIQTSGLQTELREFWNDKKALAGNGGL